MLMYPVFTLYHSRWFLNPRAFEANLRGITSMRNAKLTINEINKYYNNCIAIPIRYQILIKIFGKDIGNIIHQYCPYF